MTKTAAQFRTAAVAAFQRANPGLVGLRITWGFVSLPCPYADGSGTFRQGTFIAEAEGYRPRKIVASVDLSTGRLEVR